MHDAGDAQSVRSARSYQTSRRVGRATVNQNEGIAERMLVQQRFIVLPLRATSFGPSACWRGLLAT